jgi:hypothetical protein
MTVTAAALLNDPVLSVQECLMMIDEFEVAECWTIKIHGVSWLRNA